MSFIKICKWVDIFGLGFEEEIINLYFLLFRIGYRYFFIFKELIRIYDLFGFFV